MTPRDFCQAAFQGNNIKLAFQMQTEGNVVERTLWLQTIEKPEPLLSEGERQAPVAGAGNDGRNLQALRRVLSQFNPLRHGPDSGVLEDRPQGNIDMEHAPDTRDHLRGQQRVASQFEEVVMHSDFIQAENLSPNGRYDLFCR